MIRSNDRVGVHNMPRKKSASIKKRDLPVWKQFKIPFELFEQGRQDPVVFAKEILKLSLHEGQEVWLRESITGKKNILVPSNQWGKSLCTAIKHLWYAVYKIGLPEEVRKFAEFETLSISPRLRQVRALYQYILSIMNGQMWWEEHGELKTNEGCLLTGFVVSPKNIPSTNQISQIPMVCWNGSKITAGSTGADMGGALAGGQFAYISYDECSMSLNLEEELPARIMSRLIRYGGTLDLIGTPDVDSPSFLYYQRLVEFGIKHQEGWTVQFGRLDDNIFIPVENRESVKQSIRTTNPEKYRQVVFGEFVKGGSMVFRPGVVKNVWVPEWELFKLEEGSWNVKPPNKLHSYVIGVDWAVSIDYTVMIVMDYTTDPWEVVHFYRIRGSDKPPQEQYMDLMVLREHFQADIMMDTNGLGGKLIESEFREVPNVHGFGFAPGKKTGFIATLKKALYWNGGAGRIRAPYIPEMEEELGAYSINDLSLIHI